MIKELKKLAAIESVANHGEGGYPYGSGPATALKYVLELCESFGFRTKNANGKYGYAEIGEGEELIGILCHLDVVPAGEGWDYPPYDVTEVDGRLYGRGVIDDKGPTIASIFAMKSLLDSGKPLTKRIRIIFGQTEENGDWYDMDAYIAKEELPTYGITPDGDFPAIYGEKGILLVKLMMPLSESGIDFIDGGSVPNMVPDRCVAKAFGKDFETKGKSTHGSAPWGGENAITAMMELLEKEGSDFAKMYMALIGRDVYGAKMGCDFSDEESGKLSVNVGMVKMEEANICAYLDIRYPVTFKKEQILEVIEKAAKAHGAKSEFRHHMPPVYMDKNGTVMKKLLSAYRQITGDESEPLVIGGGTYARAMPGIIAFGPNFPGHECPEHEKNEYITVEDLNNVLKIYTLALESLVFDTM